MLQGHTGALTDQALQLLEFRHHVRSEEVGVLQDGVLLAGHTQDGSYEPGTDRQTQEPLRWETEPASPVTDAQHHQHHL